MAISKGDDWEIDAIVMCLTNLVVPASELYAMPFDKNIIDMIRLTVPARLGRCAKRCRPRTRIESKGQRALEKNLYRKPGTDVYVYSIIFILNLQFNTPCS
jgi:hypothetical protein